MCRSDSDTVEGEGNLGDFVILRSVSDEESLVILDPSPWFRMTSGVFFDFLRFHHY